MDKPFDQFLLEALDKQGTDTEQKQEKENKEYDLLLALSINTRRF